MLIAHDALRLPLHLCILLLRAQDLTQLVHGEQAT
jgi:hypothetical protein